MTLRKLVLNCRDDRPVWAPPADLADRLRSALTPEWQVESVATAVSSRGDGGSASAEALAAARGAEVYIGAGVPRDLLLAAGPTLRWAHSTTAGVASFLYPEMIESEVLFTNSAGIHAAPIAETVIGMILFFARGLDFAVRAQASIDWEQAVFSEAESPIREIAGAELVLLGYGGIGREVSARAEPLGMGVTALRSDSTKAEMQRALRRADYLVIAAPETPRTRNLIGAQELALMRRSAVLINVARGTLVDEQALIAALQASRLRGAALDVFASEPLPADSPLWRLANVLITPHVSAVTRRFWDRQLLLILDNLARYRNGLPLRNLVDKRRGY
ncbi:MAG: D-2-hydroxyacid dehydrogenase [Longimicrobiales bacterium]